MELKSIENKVKNEYPKISQIGEEKLKSSIPSKWVKVGLSSFIIGMLATNPAFALDTLVEVDGTVIEGGMTTPGEYSNLGEIGGNCLISIAIIGIIACVISIICTKIKLKNTDYENQENKKITIKGSIKIISLVSIVLLLIGIVMKILFSIS